MPSPSIISFTGIINNSGNINFTWDISGTPGVDYESLGIIDLCNNTILTIFGGGVTPLTSPYEYVSETNINGYYLSINPNLTYNYRMTISIPTEYGTYITIDKDITVSSGGILPPGGGGAVCFLGNAPVLTPSGYRRIDSLAVGDLVRTADGRDVAIQRVKHQRIVSPSAAVNPYVIPNGQFGATENLAISPSHCVAVPGRGMVEARELGLRQMSLKAAFDYYNLELPEWDNMVVAGVEVESLAPKKRVIMTAAHFRNLVGAKGTVDIAKLARIATVRADGMVDVMMTRKERRTA